MFEAFKRAPQDALEAHVKNLMGALTLTNSLIEEIRVYPEGRKPNLLFDFGDQGLSLMEKITEHMGFFSAGLQFKQDLANNIYQVVEKYDMNLSVKELNQGKAWLDENLAYIARSRDEQVELAQLLREHFQDLPSDDANGIDA